MTAQTPSIEALKRGLIDFANTESSRPPSIRQMVHDLHAEIEAARRSRRTFAQIAAHLESQGIKISQGTLQAYHRERCRQLNGDSTSEPPRRRTSKGFGAVAAPSATPVATSTSTARLNRAL